MTDFHEIDFLHVDSDKSGDAITLRYRINGATYIHVVDGGFQDTGEAIINHMHEHYEKPEFIDHVVLTHNDNDHAGGLRKLLEEKSIGTLWMLRPWLYSDELIDRFSRFTSVENLNKRLKEVYPNIAALEEIALTNKISIREPFQGQRIGAFTVLSPSKNLYLDLIVNSDKTPDAVSDEEKQLNELLTALDARLKKAAQFIKSLWGHEIFSTDETTNENEMSIVQYAELNGKKILLTGDAGRLALNNAIEFTKANKISLQGIKLFQVPHHGSRRNVSTDTLNSILGPKLSTQPNSGSETFTAIISAAKKDSHHPKKSVIRAMIHRGGKVITTEGKSVRHHHSAPKREGWVAANSIEYPTDQEG